jgi:putative tricarboxylic transport membrane protein
LPRIGTRHIRRPIVHGSSDEAFMKTPLLRNKDFLAGLMFIAIGASAMIIARDYPFGSALRMGPGYFPTILGGIVAVFGLWVLVQGLLTQQPVNRTWSVRALIILPLTALVFGIMMEKAGFVPALLVLSLMAATASPKFRLIEQSVLAVGLTVLSVSLFIYGLGLPYPLFGGH